MKHTNLLLGSIALLCLAGTAEAAPPYRGEPVLYRADSTHTFGAIVTKVIDSTTADLMLFSWGTLWAANGIIYTSEATPVLYLPGVVHGSTDGTWTENSAIPAGGSHITAISTPTLALDGSAVQFSASKETVYTASIRIMTDLSLTAGSDGKVELLCDAAVTPTTVVATIEGNTSGTIQVGDYIHQNPTFVVSWRLRAGDYCKLVTTNVEGTPDIDIINQTLQTLE